MMNRRKFLALGLVATLAACTEPLLDSQTASQLRVVDVAVDTSQIKGVTGRQITVTPAQVQTDVRNAVLAQLRANTSGTRPVKVTVVVESFALVSPGQSFLIGGVSSIRGKLAVTDANNGTAVLPLTEVFGTAKGGYAPGGLIGAISTKSPQDDYRATVAGFALDVKNRLLGAPK